MHSFSVKRIAWGSLLALVVLISGAGYVQAQSVDLKLDARLVKPITLSLANSSLEDISRTLSTHLSASIKVSPDIRDRKATLAVKDRNTCEVMEGLANCLMLKWQKDGRGYTLILPKESRELENAQLQHESAYARKALLSWVKRLKALSVLSALEIDESLKHDRWKLAHQGTTLTDSKKREIQLKLSEVSPLAVAVADSISQKNALDTLLEKKYVYASSDPEDQWLPLKVGLLPKSYENGKVSEATDAQVRIKFVAHRNLISAGYIGRSTDRVSSGWPFNSLKVQDEEPRKVGPLEERMNALCSVAVEELVKPMTSPQDAFPNPGYRSNLVTLAEHILYLSRHTKLDIIADGYRRAFSVARPATGATVGDYLETFKSKNSGTQRHFYNADYVRAEDGFLMVRHTNFWNLQQEEIPERILRPIEEQIAKRGYSTIEDYSSIVSQVPEAQMAAFEVDSKALFRFSKLPIYQCSKTLELWSRLSPSQKEAAQSEDGIGFAVFSGSQMKAAREALLELIWKLSLPGDQVHGYIQNRYDLSLHGLRLDFSDRQSFQDSEYTAYEDNVPSRSWLVGARFNFHIQIPGKASLTTGAWLDKVRESK